jgi:hypothetical protein
MFAPKNHDLCTVYSKHWLFWAPVLSSMLLYQRQGFEATGKLLTTDPGECLITMWHFPLICPLEGKSELHHFTLDTTSSKENSQEKKSFHFKYSLKRLMRHLYAHQPTRGYWWLQKFGEHFCRSRQGECFRLLLKDYHPMVTSEQHRLPLCSQNTLLISFIFQNSDVIL